MYDELTDAQYANTVYKLGIRVMGHLSRGQDMRQRYGNLYMQKREEAACFQNRACIPSLHMPYVCIKYKFLQKASTREVYMNQIKKR
jgi:hypothetical protein